MYEKVSRGLGWNEPEGLHDLYFLSGACNLRGPSGSTREICFDTTAEDEEIARQAGCSPLQALFSDETVGCNNDRGRLWCCPEGYPREYLREIPPEVSVYEQEQKRLLEQAPMTQPPSDTTPSSVSSPVSRHTFWTRLTHPGALAAIGVLAGSGVLFYFMQKRRQDWS
ncbi:MAG: hypothetical protein ACYS7Y_10705 [Planctomycetota bacterium]|jgi:hypothetical protein